MVLGPWSDIRRGCLPNVSFAPQKRSDNKSKGIALEIIEGRVWGRNFPPPYSPKYSIEKTDLVSVASHRGE